MSIDTNKFVPLKDYLNSIGRPYGKLKCEHCGKVMLDLHDEKYRDMLVGPPQVPNGPKTFILRQCYKEGHMAYRAYAENDQERWLLRGRTLSGKVYFRKICWKCFFKLLAETTDIARKARKSKWYKRILDGNPTVPPSATSPSPYFKLLFDITDEELNHERSKFDTASKESFIRRHGEEAGLEKFKAYRDRQAYTGTTEYLINDKGLTPEEAKARTHLRAITKKNLIARYGKEDGLARWKAYCEKQVDASNTLQYFIEKLGPEEGRKKYVEVCAQKALTLDNFIRKYGDELGNQKWQEYLKNGGLSYSAISQELFDDIRDNSGLNADDMFYATNNSERTIKLYESYYSHAASLDFLYEPTKKVIEFFGDYWHANPTIYGQNDIVNNSKASTIWDHDLLRLKAIEGLGYKVHIVWEIDYRTDPDKVLKDCIEFLKS